MSDKLYKLLDENGNTYLSKEKGSLGGNKAAKIYGRLDCLAARRALRQETGYVYVENRVFFKDEKTALAAGYRPCGTCMREHYKIWKEDKDKLKELVSRED